MEKERERDTRFPDFSRSKRGISQPWHPDINLQRNFVVVRSPCAAKIRVRIFYPLKKCLNRKEEFENLSTPCTSVSKECKEISNACTQRYLVYWDETFFNKRIKAYPATNFN